MIGTSIICFMGLYAMTLVDYSLTDYVFDELDRLAEFLRREAASCNATDNMFSELVLQLKDFSQVAREIWFITTIFASLTSVSYTFHVLACYRKHLRRLWAGQKGFLPKRYHNPNPAVSVAAITRYSGWQIAYTMWGFLIIHFVQFLFGLLVAYALVLPIKRGQGLYVLAGLAEILMNIALVVGLVVLQIFLVQLFFLQEKISPTDKKKPLALNNRKAFHNFTYFFFFYNVMLGLANCMLRLICSCVLGTWLVSRIDRTVMQRGYEALDPGYATWIGMIFADHYHSNPVMITFCHLLLAERLEREKRLTVSYSRFHNTPSESVSCSRARQRWLLFYTLLRNPKLTSLRRPDPPCRSPTPPGPPPAPPRLTPRSGRSARWTNTR
ncbi:hypothetical protein AAFF_G00303320 [Aldrovandia affinis]|uniref:STRA6-like n=1 Tax=Aldrovandia affinis TaxID=143900 RepID=A0AAD7W086_9TELE|nr:hypothetical protein AAFF_G00303320 [Aldrovandia affinis]